MRRPPDARSIAVLLALAHAWLLQAPAIAGAAGEGQSGPETLKMGRMTLHRCETTAPWCGILQRPLDPTGAVATTIPVYFEYYPRSGPGPAAGTLVATEGGPGYPATESREEYLALFGPLRATHDVLIMDNRGTGRSGAVNCVQLQNAPALTQSNVGECGRSLGRAASWYSTALASDDLAALLEALSIDRVGLYGDSYGTYFAQVFALRHREKLRSLVLDGAYPLDGPDYAWYPHYAPAMRDKFNLACERAPACASLPGSSMQHMAPALQRLRERPFTAQARYGDGAVMDLTADATQLAIVMFAGSPAYATVRELDAAARAFSAGDSVPLLRLTAETLASVDSRDPSRSPAKFSAGLAAAVFCHDPPQIFDMHLAPALRVAARDQLIRQRELSAPATYAPFAIDEYRRMPLDYAFIDECVLWPVPAPGSPSPLLFDAARYPDVPVLVISGELDNMTSVADGADAAARFPHAHHVVMANSFHVNALPHARSECAAILVRRFMQSLSTGDESCAAAVPPVRLVPRFARRARELAAAQPAAANRADEEQLRVVTAALLTCEDAIVRARENGVGEGVGLRGGGFAVAESGEGYRLTLHEVRWTEDVDVSGRIDWPGRDGVVHADLEIEAPQAQGTLELSWPEGESGARATARGRLGGNIVAAEAPAPSRAALAAMRHRRPRRGWGQSRARRRRSRPQRPRRSQRRASTPDGPRGRRPPVWRSVRPRCRRC
jgi:pimeloyl-ACP methyl ester carboxylesterase